MHDYEINCQNFNQNIDMKLEFANSTLSDQDSLHQLHNVHK